MVVHRFVVHGGGGREVATVVDDSPPDLEPLCELHRSLGVPDDYHIVRGVVSRGRAASEHLGTQLGPNDTLPELTLTAEGVFLHPFAPTVQGGVTDVDLRVGDELFPLQGRPPRSSTTPAPQARGEDVVRNVR